VYNVALSQIHNRNRCVGRVIVFHLDPLHGTDIVSMFVA
jgi:hypothetical protein